MHQVIEWLNENERRAYPLLPDSGELTHTIGSEEWTIPENFFLDLQIISPRTLRTHSVQLTEITYTGESSVVVKFTVNGEEVTSFTVASPVDATYPHYVRNTDGSLAVFGEGVKEFAQLCSTPVTLQTALTLEPTVCSEYTERWLGVSSLGVIPEKKTIAGTPLSDWLFPYEPLRPIENVATPTRLTGHIKLLDGYNFDVSTSIGVIELTIGFGEGLRMDCTTNFLAPEYLDCSKLISYINGMAPDDEGVFKLSSSSDIVITAGSNVDSFNDMYEEISNQNTLFFGFAQKSSDLCAPLALPPN
jgi:hypothetical protein